MNATTPNVAAVPRDAPFDLKSDALDRLDAVATYPALLKQIHYIESTNIGGLPEDIARKLDRLYLIRFSRIHRSRNTQESMLSEFDDHLARVAHDTMRDHLDSMASKFHARWTVLRDQLALLRLKLSEEQRFAEGANVPLWETVSTLVLASGAEGLPLKKLRQELSDRNVGPQTKGGATNLVASMRAVGWLEQTRFGREVQVFAGPTLLNRVAKKSAQAQGESEEHARQDAARAPIILLKHTIPVITDAVAYHTSRAARYAAVGADLHRTLRRTMESDSRNTDELLGHYRNLIRFLNSDFYQVCHQHFSFVKDYFKGRHIVLPRLCLKGLHQVNVDGSSAATVTTILRDKDPYSEPATTIQNNTALERASEEAAPYLVNSLAEAAGYKVYRNPRLDLTLAEKFASEAFHGRTDTRGYGENEITWARCWKDYEIRGSDVQAFYQSTMVAPIIFDGTLTGNLPSIGFDKHMAEHLGLESGRNHILGFLCVDHITPDYFETEIDERFAKTLADMLVPYFVTRLGLTKGSSSFLNVLETLELERMKQSIRAPSTIIQVAVTQVEMAKQIISMDSELFEGNANVHRSAVAII